jgi:hypothetical protein
MGLADKATIAAKSTKKYTEEAFVFPIHLLYYNKSL